MNKYEEAYNNIGNVYVASEGKDLIASDYYENHMDILFEATKKAEALDIIKSKVMFSFHDFKYCDTVEEYNDLYPKDSQLTQQEFELLKEILNEL